VEMKVDGNVVKSERRKRAWSQERLAVLSGLGRRTIQRIEKSNTASYESIQALAAVFSLRAEDLVMAHSENRSWRFSVRKSTFIASMISGGVLTFLATNSWAEKIM